MQGFFVIIQVKRNTFIPITGSGSHVLFCKVIKILIRRHQCELRLIFPPFRGNCLYKSFVVDVLVRYGEISGVDLVEVVCAFIRVSGAIICMVEFQLDGFGHTFFRAFQRVFGALIFTESRHIPGKRHSLRDGIFCCVVVAARRKFNAGNVVTSRVAVGQALDDFRAFRDFVFQKESVRACRYELQTVFCIFRRVAACVVRAGKLNLVLTGSRDNVLFRVINVSKKREFIARGFVKRIPVFNKRKHTRFAVVVRRVVRDVEFLSVDRHLHKICVNV